MTLSPERDDVLTDDELAALLEQQPATEHDVAYQPSARQAIAHGAAADELLYGGAAGGGKSRFARAEALAFLLEVPGAAAVLFRRSFPDLNRADGPIRALLEEVPRSLGRYHTTDHTWTLRNGSTLELAHLARDADVTKYQGPAYQLVIFEEATHFTEYQYRYLLSRLRASGAVAHRMAQLGYRPRVILTANPGGVGHAWVKARFIDPGITGRPFRPAPTADDPKPAVRMFVPAKASDNPHIDPTYVDRLNRLDEDTRRALLDGDWDVYAGQRFRGFRRDVHVIDPEQLPIPIGGVARAWGVDYGLDAPFAALLGARLGDGLVVVTHELYQAGLTPTQQAERIAAVERAVGLPRTGTGGAIALDPSTWARNPHVRAPLKGDPTQPADRPPPGSIADAYRKVLGGRVKRAVNDRLAGVAAIADLLRVRPDGLPRILVYSTCRNLIRTLPALPRDERRPEDVDTRAEDHAYDGLRYLVAELRRAPISPAEQQRRDQAHRDRHGAPLPNRDATAGATITGGLGEW